MSNDPRPQPDNPPPRQVPAYLGPGGGGVPLLQAMLAGLDATERALEREPGEPDALTDAIAIEEQKAEGG